jgi:UDP-glucose 4-epimerase
VLDNLSRSFRDALTEQVTLVAGDVGDAELVSQLIAKHGISAIMHFAASTVVPESVAHPVAYYRSNTVNSLALRDAAMRGGVRHFVFLHRRGLWQSREPACHRGRSAAVDLALRHLKDDDGDDAASASGLTCVELRYFNVAGA